MLYKLIICAVDFSPHSERAVHRAKQLADATGASLRLLHVVEAPTYPVLEDVAVAGLPGMWDVEVTQALMEASEKRLRNIAQRFEIPEENCDTIVGVAKLDIVEHADQVAADLIVMGRHGEGFFESLIGSVTDSVMHHAHCDVLAVTLEDERPKETA
ncbi:universal stress protein A [Sulfurivirga caldicuralii]|uniref:Universal stress protein n=1 Tax=Sulfurivirga caldicuralii TaxID=364032 RepID=A0A1N6F815_9GAMM|nr:universal stress protein [Sulfurivirga caldicuralii]SIN91413.1 universal stress protein A [Sulfurivirga caldicuralii]